MPRVIMLAGAPRREPWQENELTVNELLPAFRHLEYERVCWSTTISETSTEPDGSPSPPVWRSIPVKPVDLSTGWSQRDFHVDLEHDGHLTRPDDQTPLEQSFLTTTSLTSANDTDADNPSASNPELSQHLEQSFALHEEAPSSSQVTPATETPHLLLRRQSTTKAAASPTTPTPSLHLPYLTTLADLPPAATVTSLAPQTLTADLLVGIISTTPPRTVTIRRTGRPIALLEALVGDDTRAGFSITFWLGSPDAAAAAAAATPLTDGQLQRAVHALRPGDVVGVKNVALGVYRGQVVGQSLRGRTDILRVPGGKGAAERLGMLDDRVKRVKVWVADFVRPACAVGRGENGTARKRKRAIVEEEELPPDETQ